MKKSKTHSDWRLRKPRFVVKGDKRYPDFKKHLKKTGISPDEMWSLDSTISEFALPRLRFFRKYCAPVVIPGCFLPKSGECSKSEEKRARKRWLKTLDKIIRAHELVVYTLDGNVIGAEAEIEIAEGLKLFSKYYRTLWY